MSDLTADEARALTDRIKVGVADLLPVIREAFERHADAALGYANWSAYCDTELRGLRLPIGERREVVAELRQAGMSSRAIGSALGVDQKTVVNDLRRIEESSSVDLPDRITGLDGRERSATRPPLVEAIRTEIEDAAERVPQPDLGAFVSADPEVQSAQLMRRFLEALAGAGRVVEFDADQVASLADAGQVELLRHRAESLNSFADKVIRARRGLRVVRGEAR